MKKKKERKKKGDTYTNERRKRDYKASRGFALSFISVLFRVVPASPPKRNIKRKNIA